jgi:dCMP deaminase
MNRPNWDQYFISLCYLAASRSQDDSTHAGTVIVRSDNSVVTTGYNNPIRGMDISEVPKTRPEKYFYMEHAERNAIYTAAGNGVSLKGCKLYINFLPCADCARAIVQSGISSVIVHREGQDAFNEANGLTGGDWDSSFEATLKILTRPTTRSLWHKKTGSMLRWWSGELYMPTGFFRGKEYKL